MFYRPADGHGLPHNPFNAIVTPRPIGWISTRSREGIDNLAPYSFFNAVAYVPPQVMFSSTSTKPDQKGTKDSVANIRDTGVFCVNIVAYAARDAMNATSEMLPSGVDEFAHAGLQKAQAREIDCPYVRDAPAVLECVARQILPLEGAHNTMVIAEVVGVHMRDETIIDGRFDITRYRPLARMGYRDYAVVTEVFELARPDDA